MATRAPYTLTHYVGGPPTALATVGAIPHTDPSIPAWNPFARNDTRYRNIILVGHDADAEHRFLGTNPHFPYLNPFAFATTGAILDNQRLYMMLHPHVTNKIGLEALIGYCFPGLDMRGLHLHQAGNDAYWELKCCMVLLARLAALYAPESVNRNAFPKMWDAIFMCIDVEAWNGRQERLTELGFAWLDSRHVHNIHAHPNFDAQIRAKHIIIKGAVPKMNEQGVRVWKGKKWGNGNEETDSFYPRFGASMEIWPNQIPYRVNRLFFVDARTEPYQWLAPANLKADKEGEAEVKREGLVRSARVERTN